MKSFDRFFLWFSSGWLLWGLLFLSACRKDDPQPVNEEEVITTVQIDLVPDGGGSAVTLKFFDADGEFGSTQPELTVTGPLQAGTSYAGTLQLLNETNRPVEDITAEVREEGHDHLVCYASFSNLVIGYTDEDEAGLPLGLATRWVTGEAGPSQVTVSLRHQAGTKTGDCPGSGDTDVEVTFDLVVE